MNENQKDLNSFEFQCSCLNTWRILLFVPFCCVWIQGLAHLDAQEKRKQSAEPAFIIREVTTQFQKKRLGFNPSDNQPTFFITLRGTPFMNGEQSKIDRIWTDFDIALSKLEKSGKPTSCTAVLYEVAEPYKDNFPTLELQRKVGSKMTKLIEKHIEKRPGGSTSVQMGIGGWSDQLKRLNDKFSESDEPVFGNEEILVYPIKTSLSHFLLGADCYIEILAPIDEKDGFLDSSIRSKIKKIIGSCELDWRRKLLFVPRSIEAGIDWEDALDKELTQFANELGFEDAGYSYSPAAIQLTESLGLIGSPAPDFTLTEFATDEELTFSRIREGKCVLLNFWGNT